MRRHSLRIMLGGVLLFGSLQVHAQNLIANNNFATDLSGWADYGPVGEGTRTWTSNDVDGLPASGSATFVVSVADGRVGLAQCVPVTASQTYAYYASIQFPTGQSTGVAQAMMGVEFFTTTDCSSVPGGAEGQGAIVGTAYPLSDTAWETIPGDAEPGTESSATSPVGSASAQVRVFVEQLSGSENRTVRFDKVVFHNAASVPVSLQNFDVE